MVIEKQQWEGAAGPESNAHHESTPLVLVVDDEPELASLLKEWLEDDGYRACSATDGEEAIGIFSRGGVNLVITDLVMPAMDGFELIGRLRQISDVPVLVITAFDKEENLLRAGAMGACGHMVKPIPRKGIPGPGNVGSGHPLAGALRPAKDRSLDTLEVARPKLVTPSPV